MKRWIFGVVAGTAVAFAAATPRGGAIARPAPTIPETAADVARISSLLEEMSTANLAALPALPIEEFAVPPASVDVMRVQLSETYTVDGIGRDTVQLTGWIAVKHDNPRPAPGERDARWGTVVSDTEFVGLELRGQSSLFGPVTVSLDPDVPSAGRVGKLETPFLARIGLDLAYRDYRQRALPLAGDLPGTAPAEAMATEGAVQKPQPERAAIEAVLRGVWKGIEAKDPKEMIKYYSPNADNVFFNTVATTGVKVQGSERYIQGVSRMFENLKSVKVIPNDDLKVTVAGKLAVATVSGRNDIVDNEGRRGAGLWRWTVQLEGGGSTWRITHDHLSFYDDPAADRSQVINPAAKCVANIAVAINMPQLDLEMRTKYPVQWYSEVTTIPPVGHVASVSLTPTPLLSKGREVATLQRGAVTFREVVKHVRLDGTPAAGSAAGPLQ